MHSRGQTVFSALARSTGKCFGTDDDEDGAGNVIC